MENGDTQKLKGRGCL